MQLCCFVDFLQRRSRNRETFQSSNLKLVLNVHQVQWLDVDSVNFYGLILQDLIWMGSSKSKLQIYNSEVLKETRQLQGVSSQSFCQVNNLKLHQLSQDITSI